MEREDLKIPKQREMDQCFKLEEENYQDREAQLEHVPNAGSVLHTPKRVAFG